MAKRSEGVRRIVLVLSVLSVIGWITWAGFETSGFYNIPPIGWVILLVGVPIVYIIPQLITKVSYWVMDGFKKDKKT